MTTPNPSAFAAQCGTLRAEGPWFRDEAGRKTFFRGVTYGPFRPDSQGRPWPEEPQLRADFAHIRTLGFDTVRIYEPPTDAVLRACEESGLRLLCGIPWTQHVDFMTDKDVRDDARRRVVHEARRLADHPCVAGFLVGNEIEKTLVRWMGPERVLGFVEELIAAAQQAAPGRLVSYAGYPSTEYLMPRNADFIAFNVFLEKRDVFARYVQHLQNLAAGRPLVITEFGLDAKAHGVAAQEETFRWQQEVCAEAGVAGSFWFSYTDEWHRGGEEVRGWEFGLVTRERVGRPAAMSRAASVQVAASNAPPVSIIVCTHNGAATLSACLEALGRQTHPGCEVLVIDDGSTDGTPDLARSFDFVRYHRQEHAGLSAARNLGMELATGELLAYTDDDCIPDEGWLVHVSRAFSDARCVAAGGPNLPPPPRNLTEACVAVAPGAPSHVLLDDIEAEHLPGCNLVIRKSALRAIGGFREEFTTAGDDVDVCWRLQAHGGRLHFVPGAVVWHHRRRTVRAYLRQQRGYGRAEAMLVRRYPHRFAWLGGARWRGMIYGDTPPHLLNTGAVIRYGRFGNALFQTVYAGNAASIWDWMTGLPWLAASLLVFACTGTWSNAWLIGVAMLLLMAAAAWRRTRVLPGAAAKVTARHVPVLWLLCLLQPVVRDWGRLSGMVRLHAWPKGKAAWPLTNRGHRAGLHPQRHWSSLVIWNEDGVTRDEFLGVLRQTAAQHHFDWVEPQGDSLCDAELRDAGGGRFGVQTVTEYHAGGRRLTRVRFGTRRSWWHEAMALAWPLAVAVAWGKSWPAGVRLGLVGAGLLWLWWSNYRRLHRTRLLRDLLLSAAVDCGLCSRGSMPEAPGQRVLASAPQSAEVCLDKS